MTDNQKRFCDEYLIDRNGTRAYKAAYPNIKNDRVAASNANRMLRNADIRKYIDEQLAAVKTENIADAQEVMSYITSVMRNKHEETKNRIKAAELMGKRYGLFRDNISVTGAIPVVIDGGDELED